MVQVLGLDPTCCKNTKYIYTVLSFSAVITAHLRTGESIKKFIWLMVWGRRMPKSMVAASGCIIIW